MSPSNEPICHASDQLPRASLVSFLGRVHARGGGILPPCRQPTAWLCRVAKAELLRQFGIERYERVTRIAPQLSSRRHRADCSTSSELMAPHVCENYEPTLLIHRFEHIQRHFSVRFIVGKTRGWDQSRVMTDVIDDAYPFDVSGSVYDSL